MHKTSNCHIHSSKNTRHITGHLNGTKLQKLHTQNSKHHYSQRTTVYSTSTPANNNATNYKHLFSRLLQHLSRKWNMSNKPRKATIY